MHPGISIPPTQLTTAVNLLCLQKSIAMLFLWEEPKQKILIIEPENGWPSSSQRIGLNGQATYQARSGNLPSRVRLQPWHVALSRGVVQNYQ